jgi:hypothetical protein
VSGWKAPDLAVANARESGTTHTHTTHVQTCYAKTYYSLDLAKTKCRHLIDCGTIAPFTLSTKMFSKNTPRAAQCPRGVPAPPPKGSLLIMNSDK